MPISREKRKGKHPVTFARLVRAGDGDKLWPMNRPGRFSPDPRGAACLGAFVAFFAAGEARAADPNPTNTPVVYQRRGGFLVGIALGPVIGVASGYPNDARKIDRSEFFTSTGVSGGGSGSLWIGVAFTDWLSFGLAGYGGGMLGGGDLTRYGAGSFRVEAFPGYPLGGAWRDFGASIEAGVALAAAAPREGGDDLVASGGASRFAFGLFYEGIRAWKISMGPFASADVIWSPSATRPLAWIGWRTVLYTKP